MTIKPIRKTAGFTLIEIMVVVIIIGILATFVLPNVVGQLDKASRTQAIGQMKSIETGLLLYKLENLSFPTTEQGLEALVSNVSGKSNWNKFMPSIPKDPWGNDYHYQYPASRGGADFDLWSYGADGAEGGSGNNADIGNWTE